MKGGLIVLCLICSLCLSAQDQKKIETRPTMEVGYGFGGQFYLNYLEYNPMLSFYAGIDQSRNFKSHFSFLTGMEILREQTLVPVIVRYAHGLNNRFYLQVGMAFGLWNEFDAYDEYDHSGGPLAGLGYARTILELDGLNLILMGGYDFRTSQLEFKANSGTESVTTDLQHHFFTIRLKAEL